MFLRLTHRLSAASLLALSLVCAARAGVRETRTLRVDADHPSAVGPIEIPAGERIARAEAISVECAEDGARAPAGVTVRVGYQGFERGRHLAWLELPDGCGLAVEHARHAARHAARLQVLLELEPSTAGPVAREREVPEWEDGSGSPRAGAATARTSGNPAGTFDTRAGARRAESFGGTPL